MLNKFTCICCRVMFSDAEIQRCHYKTDWHRYNLKRKVVSLPPVTAEEFQKRVLHQREMEKKTNEDKSVFCKLCRKSFATEKSFENHINSKKHKESLSLSESDVEITAPVIQRERKPSKSAEDLEESLSDSEVEEVDSDEWEDIDEEEEEVSEGNPVLANNCLFCPHHSRTMSKNIYHMSVEHSFFIPDVDYVVDIRRLLLYLGEKVCRFHQCLWCGRGSKGFQSMEAAQAHMRDKGHTKVYHEGPALIEFEPYYNYSQSYPDAEEAMDIDEEVELTEVDGSDYMMTLPSGATIGHRSLLVYFKQHVNPNREVVPKKSRNHKVIGIYRALGWSESDKQAIIRKTKDLKYMMRQRSRYEMQLGVKGNKLQKHFRPQVNF